MADRNFGNPGPIGRPPLDNDTGRANMVYGIADTHWSRRKSWLFTIFTSLGLWATIAIIYAAVYFVTRALGWW